ncbi:unnamed protein product [Dimorphilus gyrociliatus]|uniref:Uncharacterized protein n=1 Tax=Dimorphilus gyrociliatus TaxID=2664684 RepID=A0A7I8VSF4_9ANNE|nr:unnamed protein product [Dimorphilus gyrociliatus]
MRRQDTELNLTPRSIWMSDYHKLLQKQEESFMSWRLLSADMRSRNDRQSLRLLRTVQDYRKLADSMERQGRLPSPIQIGHRSVVEKKRKKGMVSRETSSNPISYGISLPEINTQGSLVREPTSKRMTLIGLRESLKRHISIPETERKKRIADRQQGTIEKKQNRRELERMFLSI